MTAATPGPVAYFHKSVANPFDEPVVVACEVGPRHEIIFRDREGEVAWRLSDASPPPQAASTIEIAPGEEIVIEEIWQPGAAHTAHLPPGRYSIEAEFGGVLTAPPHTIAVGSLED